MEAEVGKYISGQETSEAQMLVAVGAGEPHRSYVFPGLASSASSNQQNADIQLILKTVIKLLGALLGVRELDSRKNRASISESFK